MKTAKYDCPVCLVRDVTARLFLDEEDPKSIKLDILEFFKGVTPKMAMAPIPPVGIEPFAAVLQACGLGDNNPSPTAPPVVIFAWRIRCAAQASEALRFALGIELPHFEDILEAGVMAHWATDSMPEVHTAHAQ